MNAGAHPRVAQELLAHAVGSRVTMERYAHVTARQQRVAADVSTAPLPGSGGSVEEPVTESVTESVTAPVDAVVGSGPDEDERPVPIG